MIRAPGMRRWPARLLALLAALMAVPAAAAERAVPGDRWLEIDLYWFDPGDIARSVDTFWDRYQPLFRDVRGYRGVVLNVGLTVNYIMEFSGDPAQRIALPTGTGQELGSVVAGALAGDTAQRQAAWKARFRSPPTAAAQIGYGRWSYAQLGRVAALLRAEGARRGIAGFRVATLAVGVDNAYGEQAPFARRHPEAWHRWGAASAGELDTSAYLDPVARLHADPARRAGLPGGIAEGLPVADALAAQWGALSTAIGLDGLMLRDSLGFPRGFTRYGPAGAALPGADVARTMSDGVAALVRDVKRANPRALVMMWSTAASATSDWRANGVDLERIAREGYLDIFVDQTWAGAWNEVGVRRQTFWNAPILGWTYQLGYLLEHAAVLAGSRVHHYPLVETFDAWESWDTIHTAPGRLRWGIWAYAHAAVKTPSGLAMPNGSYISWGNHGHELLSAADVAFLAATMNAAARDAARTNDVAGPTIVYARDAIERQLARLGRDVDDRTDEQVGSLVKWPLPILSATRLEWLPQVRSDLFVFGATAGLPAERIATIAALARRGQPMAFLGALGGGTDPALAALAGVTAAPHDPPQQDRSLRAAIGDAPALAIANIPRDFDAPPPSSRGTAGPGTTVYAVGDGAALVLDEAAPLSLSLWDPAPLSDYWYRPLRELMNGSAAPYALAAATLTRQLARAGRLHAAVVDLAQTGTVAGWTTRDGRAHLLAGNLEEGLRDDADHTRHLLLRLPAAWRAGRWRCESAPAPQASDDGVIALELGGEDAAPAAMPGLSASLLCSAPDRARD